jgi:O-methyltransferase involved in polyketide biosynthesis
MPHTERVSPTAYATGYFWVKHGLSHEALATPEGRKLDSRFGWLIRGIRLFSGVSLTHMMLARHRGIDAQLARAIEDGRVGQVIELAAGLSGRGTRFVARYPQLTYVETDLPAMAATKKDLLDRGGLTGPRHRVVVVDAMLDDGEQSLSALAATLDPARGTAIITEGLMSYLDPEVARDVWKRIATTLKRFPHGVYLSDLYLKPDRSSAGMLAFRTAIQKFVRGKMHIHFALPEQAQKLLRSLGFADVAVHLTSEIPETQELARTPGGDRVRVLEAWV